MRVSEYQKKLLKTALVSLYGLELMGISVFSLNIQESKAASSEPAWSFSKVVQCIRDNFQSFSGTSSSSIFLPRPALVFDLQVQMADILGFRTLRQNTRKSIDNIVDQLIDAYGWRIPFGRLSESKQNELRYRLIIDGESLARRRSGGKVSPGNFEAWSEVFLDPTVSVDERKAFWDYFFKTYKGVKSFPPTQATGADNLKSRLPMSILQTNTMVEAIDALAHLRTIKPDLTVPELIREMDRQNLIFAADDIRKTFHLDVLGKYHAEALKSGFMPNERKTIELDYLWKGAQLISAIGPQSIDSRIPLTSAEREVLADFYKIMKNTLAHAYSGRNQRLKQISLTESIGRGTGMEASNAATAATGLLDDFIRSERFRLPFWWIKGADISSANSASPLVALYGKSSVRSIFWPGHYVGDFIKGDLNGIRIAVNSSIDKSGKEIPRSLELFVKDKKGKWNPFFYERRGDDWIPSQEFMGKPVRQSCAICHAVNGEFSPRPQKLMRLPEQLKKAGYRDSDIEMLMQH